MTLGRMVLQPGSCELVLWGHATGSAEVCAAISGLVYSLVGYLNNSPEHVPEKPECNLAPGRVRIRTKGDNCVEEVFRMVGLGLMQIMMSHPEYLAFDMVEK